MNKSNIKLIGIAAFLTLLLTLSTKSAFADSYGGDCDDCNTRFRITKEVRIEGENSWKDKITDVGKGDVVEFRITIKNKSDDKVDSADNMKMEDFLPDEMYRVGGSGLTEYWEDFESGEEKKFTIKAKVKDSEYDRDVKFEKCIVNKAEVRWDGDFEGADTATVCYGNVQPTELPKTGAVPFLALGGLGMLATGLVSKKKLINK